MSTFFGTDGLRGIIGDDLTHEIAYNCGNALGKISPKSNILLGKDTRISGDYISTAFASGLISAGCNITMVDICPTPGIAYLTHTLGFDYGVAITASHNPLDHNGIKIFDNNYRKISDKKEELIEKNFFRHILTSNEDLGQITYNKKLVAKYETFLKEKIKNLHNLKIVFDCANGATSEVIKNIFKEYSNNIIIICNNTDGKDINRDCGATNLDYLIKTILNTNADIGFAFDGDGDRVIAIDNNGKTIDGDQIIYILAKDYLNKNILKSKEIVGTRHTNMGMELGLKKIGITLDRAEIGDKYVASKLAEKNLQIGGEQSGHIIQRDILPTGDGILTAITLINIILDSNTTLSNLCDYTPYKQCNINVRVENKLNIINNSRLSAELEKRQEELKDIGRIMVRISGTEPVIRIMVESSNLEKCKDIANSLAEIIKLIDKESN